MWSYREFRIAALLSTVRNMISQLASINLLIENQLSAFTTRSRSAITVGQIGLPSAYRAFIFDLILLHVFPRDEVATTHNR